MKRRFIVPVLFLSMATIGANAQKLEKEKIGTLLSSKKLDEAKKEMDKVLANPEEAAKPDALGLQTRVYGEIVHDSALSKQYPDALAQGFNAFQALIKATPDTAQQMKILKDPYIYGLAGVSNLYSSAFNKGLTSFKEENYSAAYNGFSTAQKLGTFFAANGLLTGGDRNAIDTTSTLYAGFAAQNLAKTSPAYADTAAVYLKILVDRKIGGTSEMENAYKLLGTYYYNKKDNEALAAFLPVAKEKFPAAKEYWDQLSSTLLTSGVTPAQLVDKYNGSSNLSESELQTYAEAFGKEKTAATDTALKSKIADAEIDSYKKLYAITPNPLYAYNVGNLTNTKFEALDDQFRAAAGQSAALKAKRTAIEANQQTLSDESADWLTKSYTALKDKADKTKQEASVYKASVALLYNIYIWKVDKARGKDPKAYDKYDALSKQFDAEYNKLQAAK